MRQITPHGALRRPTTLKAPARHLTHITTPIPIPNSTVEIRYYCKTCKIYYTLRDVNAVNPHGSHDYEYAPNWTI